MVVGGLRIRGHIQTIRRDRDQMVEYKYEDCVFADRLCVIFCDCVRTRILFRERERERVKTKRSSDSCVVATVGEVSGTRPGIFLAPTKLTGSSVERVSNHSMNERFHTLKGLGMHNMHGPVHISSVDEQNRNSLLGKSDTENMFSKDDKLPSNGQSSSDNSSLLNTSLGSDSSYQSVEDKTARRNCMNHGVINSTRDVKSLDPRHEDIVSHDDNISCVSGVDKAEDQVERENGSNGATSADKTPLMDKMVNKLVDKSNSSESPLLNDMSPKVNGSLIDVEGTKDLDIKEGCQKLCAPLEQNCNDTPLLPSQLADTKVASATTIEDEVRVCDICGDLGREYMLAICSKCSDGAEHTYCMRVPMDKVPEGDWLCEDCEVKQESKIQNQFKADTSKETLMKSSSIKDTMPKPQSFERRKPSTVVSTNTHDVSMLRKRSLEVYAESPKGSSPKRRLVKSFVQNGSIPNNVTSNSKSCLLKSKSFNVMDLKLKDRLSRQDSLKNLTMTKDVCEKKFQKSRSFNYVDTSTSDMEKAKQMVIGARQTIELISTNKINTFKPGFSKLDKKATSHGKMILPTSKASVPDREGPQSCRLPISLLARKGSIKTEPFPKPKELDSCESNPRIYIPRVLSISSQETVIPRIDRDWRGSFEVPTGGGPCTRIQAHCSSHASDNVLDLVRKLPAKILLEELPRERVSPNDQFTEDSIALFFFAEDLKSYGDYKNMLKRMMDNEFALRGHIDGAELLVFSSSILPPSSQRWNNLLFLWGLFRRRPVDFPDSSAACSDPCLSLHTVKTETCLPMTTLHKNSDKMVRASEIIMQEKLELSPLNGTNHLCRSTGESPVSLQLFPEAGQLCSMSKVPEPRVLDPKPLRGYEDRDYELNEDRSNKRMKSFGASGGFHFADFASAVSLGPPLAAIDEGVDLELSLGTLQKKDTSRVRDDEVGPVSLSLSLGLPFS